MFPYDEWIALREYREWEREFNKRAARGDFIRRVGESEESDVKPREHGLFLRLGHLRRIIRWAFA